MTRSENNEIHVYLDSPSVKAQLQLGSLQIQHVKDSEIFTFQFSEQALKNDHIRTLLPNVRIDSSHSISRSDSLDRTAARE